MKYNIPMVLILPKYSLNTKTKKQEKNSRWKLPLLQFLPPLLVVIIAICIYKKAVTNCPVHLLQYIIKLHCWITCSIFLFFKYSQSVSVKVYWKPLLALWVQRIGWIQPAFVTTKLRHWHKSALQLSRICAFSL